MSLLRALGRGASGEPPSGVVRWVRLRGIHIMVSLLPQMSFRPQSHLKCLRSHGLLLTSESTGEKYSKELKLFSGEIILDSFPFLIIVLSNDTLSSIVYLWSRMWMVKF